jgi:hypothetical protein
MGRQRQSEGNMIETYAFLAVFVLQILLMSVLFPSRLIRYTRLQVPRIPADRWAQLFPGVDVEQSVRQFATRFRLTTGLAAVLGLVLFGWFYQYMQAPDWEHGKVMGLVLAYFFLVQVMTLLIEVALGFGSYLKVLRHPSPVGRRSASLQRRDLFHFVSPFAVFLAGLAYVLFAAFMVYLWQRGM